MECISVVRFCCMQHLLLLFDNLIYTEGTRGLYLCERGKKLPHLEQTDNFLTPSVTFIPVHSQVTLSVYNKCICQNEHTGWSSIRFVVVMVNVL